MPKMETSAYIHLVYNYSDCCKCTVNLRFQTIFEKFCISEVQLQMSIQTSAIAHQNYQFCKFSVQLQTSIQTSAIILQILGFENCLRFIFYTLECIYRCLNRHLQLHSEFILKIWCTIADIHINICNCTPDFPIQKLSKVYF